MVVSKILKESFNLLKKENVLITPSIIATLLTSILGIMVVGGGGMMAIKGAMNNDPKTMSMLPYFLITGLIGFIIQSFSVCITLYMADDLMANRELSFGSSFSKTMKQFMNIFTASITIAFLVSLGIMFFLIPSLIFTYIFMFTFVIIVLKGSTAFNAMKESFSIIKANLSETLTLFLVLFALGFAVRIVAAFFGAIPVLGIIINVFFSSAFVAFSAISVMFAYRELTSQT